MTALALPTPALVVDRVTLDANLAAMQQRCDAAGVALRPHVKGHKSAWVAARQLRAGARGLAAATLEEAAGLLHAGLGGDVLVTSVLPPAAVETVAALAHLGALAVVADDPQLAAAVHERAPGVRILVDLDVGQHRGGASDPGVAVAVAAAAGDTFAGVQAYEGHLQLLARDDRRAGHERALATLTAVLAALDAAGHDPALVTSAGTGTSELAMTPGSPITEIQPGSYALMDHSYAAVAGDTFAQAAHVVTAVRSVRDGAVVVDAGLKAVSVDMGPAAVAGRDTTYTPAGDEHGVLTGDVGDLRPGDLVRLVPAHTDTTVRLHRTLWVDGVAAVPLF